jgi:carbamoyltransferase
MSNNRRVLGLNRTSDASFCLIEEGRVLLGRKERLNRKKHAWGALGDVPLYAKTHPGFAQPIDAVVECYASDPERDRLPDYQDELKAHLNLAPGVMYAEISHHYAHAYSAFHPSGFADAAILVADNRGSTRGLVAQSAEVPVGPADESWEVISVFDADESGIRTVAKQWWDAAPAPPGGLGIFYSKSSRLVLGRGNREGVLMGLAAHGTASRVKLPPLEVRGCEVLIPAEWMQMFDDPARFESFRQGGDGFSDAADFAAAVQAAFEEALIAVARHARAATGRRNLVYAGGCALNCSANARLAEEAGFDDVFVPPACDDGGTSIGCALYALERLGEQRLPWIWDVDYLGLPQRDGADELFAAAAEFELTVAESGDLVDRTARALADGQTIAIFQGRSEAGPRALGNRSILASPHEEGVRDFINAEVKHREWFRPLAPVVRLETAPRYFEMTGPSPFMQRRVMVRPQWRAGLAAVTHVDGSARVQTVTRDQNAFLYDLLGAFEQVSGTGVLLNTSFNGADEPIVDTVRDACAALRKMKIDQLIVPPFVVTKE